MNLRMKTRTIFGSWNIAAIAFGSKDNSGYLQNTLDRCGEEGARVGGPRLDVQWLIYPAKLFSPVSSSDHTPFHRLSAPLAEGVDFWRSRWRDTREISRQGLSSHAPGSDSAGGPPSSSSFTFAISSASAYLMSTDLRTFYGGSMLALRIGDSTL